LYLIEGSVRVPGPGASGTEVKAGEIAVLDQGQRVSLWAGADGTRFLLLAGRPLGEPVARAGPFVMNTRRELIQAQEDYLAGRFGGV
jgi:redox-sensitive bicupin YhaK (pirin superfamily)